MLKSSWAAVAAVVEYVSIRCQLMPAAVAQERADRIKARAIRRAPELFCADSKRSTAQ